MKILAEQRVCDGYDVTAVTDQGATVVWHFGQQPKDVEAACAEVQKDLTAREAVKEDELEAKKGELEREVSEAETKLATVKTQLVAVTAAIAAKEKPKEKEKV